MLPADGVYAGIAHVGTQPFAAAINIGHNPTFAEHARKVEVHLIGCDEPLYGIALEVDFLARLRDIHPFPDVEALKSQLARDVEQARQIEQQQ